ncbi:RNA polymerase sigma-70 factor [Pedobacter hiemivivus]|uniref:RNA polymerase sigma-70 factor n=1 Tax=Pedobacter hiemivivus TaxID=2530454 RepID=A0A4V5PCY0_9SPHI|nr:RNA polymerase sigma-70 factor [Pedobacter hiemivivus]TCC94681.1 RNA polymerase sigma-70 factor [Pedobacter hiemivivus]TKC62416.1 RNA polymerase sigma-70 factor [Pedobacter hiemivivus]
MYENLSNYELSILLKNGDEFAYLEIYDRYKVLLLKHAYTKLSDRDEADDIVQELFIHLWESRSTIEFTTNLSGYLYTAVRNRIFNHFVKRKRTESYLDSLGAFLKEGDYITEITIRERELAVLIEQEVNALPPRMREVFNLSRNSGLSHKEISEQLGTSEQTISKQISNTLKLLRAKMESILNVFI